MFGMFKKKAEPKPVAPFPPVPKWRPEIPQPIDQIVDRVSYYTDRKQDFAVFRHGTCVFLPAGLSQDRAVATAKEILAKIYNFHPDMTPTPMDDGNMVVQYREPAVNVLLNEVARRHWAEIDKNHLDALATSEVLMTPQGANKFDDFGKKALFARCFMFMDAQSPDVIRVVRSAA